MRNSFTHLLKSYAASVLLFLLAKVVFMVCNGAGHDVGIGDVLAVLRNGLSLDLSTALYFLIVPLLACMVGVWVRVPKAVLKAYQKFLPKKGVPKTAKIK